MVDCLLSVLLLLFKSFPNYALFCDMADAKKSRFLQCFFFQTKPCFRKIILVIE